METENRNHSALWNFISEENNKLINYIRKHFSESFFEADAHDIIQDVALNIYNKLDINTPIENIAGYFYRAIRNKIIDYQRKTKQIIAIENYTNEKDENILLETYSTEKSESEEWWKNEKVKDELINALNKLKPSEKYIIIESEFNGKSFEELSKKTETPIGTLLSRKHRALNKLHMLLENKIGITMIE